MHRATRQAGFTLVELLTVLVIIGLMASAVVLTLPRDKPAIDTQSQSLTSLMNAASQASLVTGRPHAFGLSKDRYAVFEFMEGEWVQRQTLDRPDALTVELRKNDIRIKLEDEIVPIVVFEPTGLSTSFELILTQDRRTETLTSSGDGRVEWVRPS